MYILKWQDSLDTVDDSTMKLHDMAQEVRAVVWQSVGCRFDPHSGHVEVSLSKMPNPRLLLTSWSVPCMAANRRWCVNVCVNVCVNG